MPARTAPRRAPYPSLTTAIAAFEATLVAKSERTAVNYRSALNRFMEYLRDKGDEPAVMTSDQIVGTVLEDFYAWLLARLPAGGQQARARKRSAVTYVAGLRAFLAFLDRRRWLHPDVSYERMREGARALIGKTPYPTPRVGEEVALVVTYVNELPVPAPDGENEQVRLALLRDRTILTTLYATALRRAELSALNRTDVQDGREREALITGKGSRERVVFFDDTALAAVRAYLRARGDTYRPLFLRHDDRRGSPGPGGERYRLSPQGVWRVVKHYAALAGVDATTHHLRHLKARVLLNNGMPLAVLQDVLGHASPDTTKRVYAPYSRASLRQSVERYTVSAEEVARRVTQAQDEDVLGDE